MLASDGLDWTGLDLHNRHQFNPVLYRTDVDLTDSKVESGNVWCFHFGCCMFCWWFVHTIFVSRFYLQKEKKIMKN